MIWRATRNETDGTRLLFCMAASTAVSSSADTPPGSHQYIVKLRYLFTQPNATATAPIQSVIPTLGGTVDNDWSDRLVTTIPDTAVPALRAHAQTRYMQRVVTGPFIPETTVTATARRTVSGHRVPVPNSTPPWKSGKYSYDGAGNIGTIGSGTGEDLTTRRSSSITRRG